jgi:NAD+ diphosphatase
MGRRGIEEHAAMTLACDVSADVSLVCVSSSDVVRPPTNVLDVLWRSGELAVPDDIDRHFVGELRGEPCFAIDADQLAQLPAEAIRAPLPSLHQELDPELFTLISRAVQLIAWTRTSRFCGRCGTPTVRSTEHRAYVCPACGLLAFPRLAPAVIVLIESGDRILLARSPTFPEPFYAPLAGFVEPAETLEQAIHREVQEEVGLKVGNIQYFGSQPWPYPHTLLSAFTATAESTEMTLDRAELVDASWFIVDDLPPLPPKLSISRMLIDDWAIRARAAV